MTTTPPTLQTTVYGKWILTGEHAVLRGHPAIIFPIKSKSLTLSYWQTDEELRAEFIGDYAEELQFIFWSAFERALEILALHRADFSGKFHLENNIPVGSGMGASGALCVSIARFFVMREKILQENVLEFARQLENLFHSESSGADIAGALAGSPIYFSRSGGLHPIKINWQPKWYLSFSGKVSTTSRAVKKVKELFITDLELAEKIDSQMADSVSLAEKALQLTEETGLELLREAILEGYHCFEQWELTQGSVDDHIKVLLNAGALAAKPTGSGAGGYVISLWNNDPPENIGFELIKV